MYETEAGGEVFIAIDEGVLVKTGPDVLISVRRAIGGPDLAQLRESVEKEFLTLDDKDLTDRAAMDRLETGLLSRFARLKHE
jgi:F-type H+-transporting ATPase subunit epsilon